MPSRAYLHPSQRSLKTDQIGPSGHKNQYHVGVLEGNWFEDRGAFGPQRNHLPAGNHFSTATTHGVSYQQRESWREARQAMVTSPEAPRELLFTHGAHPIQSQFSTAELSFRGGDASSSLTYHDVINTTGVSPRRYRSDAKKAEAAFGLPADETAASGGDSCRVTGEDGKVRYHLPPIGTAMTRDQFTTTKHVTIDAAGLFLGDHMSEVYEWKTCTKQRGDYLKSLNNNMRQTGLRL
mmetsp:Transcript_72408/g.84111  ORF Transcript_72408/g.84111 Transcript_72408/m.84111 type:complete len:237 (+) Transcript_72408:37-747(+)